MPSFRLFSGTPRVAQGVLPEAVAVTPESLRSAYHLPSSGGYGTIAVIEAFDAQSIEDDLHVFTDRFGLPLCTTANGCFEKHLMASGIDSDPAWTLETDLDTQWLHAMAPDAKILVVEAASATLLDLVAAVDFARDRGEVVAVSMSWGTAEFLGEAQYDDHFTGHCGISFFASSGDDGNGASWPAASPNVTAVGGTSLVFDADGALFSETAWQSSGGGVSPFEKAPDYQVRFGLLPESRRYPDVAANADPASGYPVFDSFGYFGTKGWVQVGGTSASVLVWTAIKSLGLSVENARLYKDASGPDATTFFRDITSGSNGPCGQRCTAAPGFDNVTGLGSPLTTVY
jgi:subtilase family serine protease